VDGRQARKKLGPAWADRGRPAAGYFAKRLTEAWLQDVLAQARELLATARPFAHSLFVAFGELPLESIPTSMIER
jgi:hypothetical protein